MMKSVIIQGSARSAGNTSVIAQIIQERLNADLIDLKNKQIHSYSYEYHHLEDDFLPVMQEALKYETIIFITPVYWYAMSGIMKNFFDRITDCLKIEKETGRKLRGKNMIAISCGSDHTEIEGFFVPFRNSANYLGMNYLGNIHTWMDKDIPEPEVLEKIVTFIQEIKNNPAYQKE